MGECSNGHAVASGDRFCAICGEAVPEGPPPPSCPHGHAVEPDDRFCLTCGAELHGAATVPVPTCPNGHAVAVDDLFCPTCGAAVQSPTTQPITQPITPPVPPVAAAAAPGGLLSGGPTPPADDQDERGRSRWVLVAVGAIVVVLLAVGGALALTNRHGSSHVAATASSSTTTSIRITSIPTEATESTFSTPTTSDTEMSFVTQVDSMLSQFGAQRSSLATALTNLESCTASPEETATAISGIVSSRQQEITEVEGLDPGASAEAATIRNDLLAALQPSLMSDTSYQQAVSDMAACGPLDKSDPNIQAASSSDQTASVAKATFVAVYNPVAERFGLAATWQPTDL